MEKLSGLGMIPVHKRRKEIRREAQKDLEFPTAFGGALKKSGLDVCQEHYCRQLDLSEFSHMQQHARGQKPLTRVAQGVSSRMGGHSNGAVQRSCSTPSRALNRANEASEVKGGASQVQTPPCHPGASHCRRSWRTPTPRSPRPESARKSQTLGPTLLEDVLKLIWLRHVPTSKYRTFPRVPGTEQ